jgi:transcriptional regulator with XRE-family HTH domain
VTQPRTELGRVIRAVRKSLGLNQESFAGILGFSTDHDPHVQISNWECGRTTPSTLRLLAIAALAHEDEQRRTLLDAALLNRDAPAVLSMARDVAALEVR